MSSSSSPEPTPPHRWKNDPKWRDQINEGFLFSPYGMLTTPEMAFTVSTISSIAGKADTLINSNPADAGIQKELINIVTEHAAAIEASIVRLSDDKSAHQVIARALVTTQRKLGQHGELSGAEVAQATSVPPDLDLTPILGNVAAAITMLSTSDASAAIAAQRALLPAEVGRGLFAAHIILGIQAALHEKL